MSKSKKIKYFFKYWINKLQILQNQNFILIFNTIMQSELDASLSVIQNKELNLQIFQSIKKAKQKLSNDYETKENYYSSKKNLEYQIYNFGSVSKNKEGYVEKTVNSLKNKINQLQEHKIKLETKIEINNRNYSNELNSLKKQLAKYIQKQFQMTLATRSNPYQMRFQIQEIKEKLKKKDLEIEHIREKLRIEQQKNQKLDIKAKNIFEELEQKQIEKDKHIQLNMIEKSKFELQLTTLHAEKEKQTLIIKKLEQQNITLKRQIHNIFNKDRFEKQAKSVQKKSQEDYQFELKELSQKYSSKMKMQEKQIQLLRKTIQQFKEKSNDSDLNELNQYAKQVDDLKEKNMEKQKKIAIKNIEIDRLNVIIQDFEKIIKDKDAEITKITQLLDKKQISEKQLLDKLAKHGLSTNNKILKINNSTDNKRNSLNPAIYSDSPEIYANQDQDISFDQSKNQEQIPLVQENNTKSNVLHQIAIQQRALANLKSSYKNIDTKEMSLSEVMSQIRRKTDKINELKQKKDEKIVDY